MDDLEITTLLRRLGRPNRSGGVVIECAALRAAGPDYPAIIDWIVGHGGTEETEEPITRSRGLHGSRINDGREPASRQPSRYLLPADALSSINKASENKFQFEA